MVKVAMSKSPVATRFIVISSSAVFADEIIFAPQCGAKMARG
jgi:hypothetical protein